MHGWEDGKSAFIPPGKIVIDNARVKNTVLLFQRVKTFLRLMCDLVFRGNQGPSWVCGNF